MIESQYLSDNVQIVSKIRNMPHLINFDEETVKELIKLSKIRKYKKGEIIIAEGDFDSWIYFLISGRVKIIKDGEQVALFRRIGDIFGEMSIINGATRSASAYASDDTICLATDVSCIDRLEGNNKLAFGYILYRIFSEILAERLRLTTEELIKSRRLDL